MRIFFNQLFIFLCILFAGQNNVNAQVVCTIPSTPTVGTITQPTCLAGGKVVLSGLPSSGTYNILSNGSVILSNQTGTSKTITGLSAGVYNFSFQNTTTGCVSGNSTNATLNIPAVPTFTATVTQPTCTVPSGKIVITAISGHTYSIDGGAFGTATTFSGLVPGSTHALKVKKNTTGCESLVKTFTINNFTTNPLIVGDASLCRGNTVQFTTTPQIAGTWSLNAAVTGISIDQNGLATVAANSTATSFTVKFTNSSNCSVTKAITIKALPAKPTVGTVTQPTCTTTGSVILSALPSTGTYNLLSNGSIILSNQTGTSKTVSGLSAGTYNFAVQNLTTGCTSLLSNTVVLNQPVVPNFTATVTQPTCSTTTGAITVTPISGATYSFDDGATWQASNSIGNLSAGNYVVRVKSATNCISASSSFVINSISANLDPVFTQVNPICAGENIVLPTTSNNGVLGTWSPSINNQATTTYTFTPNEGQCATTATMTVEVNNTVVPVFASINPICAGENIVLPTTSNNGVSGTWSPSINNQATTTYTFTPNEGQCATTATMTVEVNPVANLVLTSSNNTQIVDANSPLQPITYNLENGASGVTITGLPTGISYNILNNIVTISGSSASIGSFNYTINTTGGCGVVTAQGSLTITSLRDWTQAPNSYTFNPNQTQNDGLYIPVGKAYAMWASNVDNILSINSPISGTQMSAYVYWEDNSGLIKTPQPNSYKLDIISGAAPNLAKIKVLIDKTKGEGNAVVTFHVGANGNSADPIHWSWHVWVTDDVEQGGSTYRQGYETDKNNVPFSQVTNRDGSLFQFKWMNRNLGATNAEFLGHDWNKSAGLMYQWGRKDPFPGLTYKDGTAYEINGEAGRYTSKNFGQNTTQSYGWTFRPNNGLNTHTEVKENIKYAINNPLRMISFLERFGHWFSDDYFKVNSTDIYTKVNWDLWGDNRKGAWSNYSTSDAAGAADSKSYELKSPYDPCPCGWRIPSHTGSIVGAGNGNRFSPLGRKGGLDDDRYNTNNSLDTTINGGQPAGVFTYTATNPYTNNVRVYHALGFDYRNDTGRNLGIMPMTGAYVFLGPNEVSDYNSATSRIGYMNWLSTGGIGLATLSIYDNASGRGFGIVGDFQKYAKDSKFRMNVNQIGQSKGAGPVRCIKDPNEKHLGNFMTEYIPAVSDFPLETLKNWTKDANTYIIKPTENSKTVNVRKAFAMQKLYISDNKEFPTGTKSVSVYWSTNPNLITDVILTDNGLENTTITINRTAGQYGNAVVALHSGNNGNASDPVIWSWQIWSPETEPQAIPKYTTESIYVPNPNNGIIVNPTESLVTPPLTTEFMDRNLGALVAFPTLAAGVQVDDSTYKKSIGLQYQWGRKDPIPTFLDQPTVFRGNSTINSNNYLDTTTGFVRNYSQYSSVINAFSKRADQIQQATKYSVENPLTFLYQDAPIDNISDWLSNEPNIASDRWGHTTQKSPYDPCPDGWRIPDTSFSFVNNSYSNPYVRSGDGVKGNSPWYYGDILDPLRTDGIKGIQQTWDSSTNTIITNSASGVYSGRMITVSNTNAAAAWVFDNTNYAIGNYPITGIRGESNSSLATNFPRVGVWTSSLGDAGVGNAIGLSIRWSKMATGGGFNPHQAMSCRCAKIQYDANGNEIGRYDPNAIPVPQDAVQKTNTTFTKKEIINLVEKDKISVYPNPVENILHINATDDKEYHFQIYNISGVLVKQGKFDNKKTDLSSLLSGLYLIRINNSKTVVKIIKK